MCKLVRYVEELERTPAIPWRKKVDGEFKELPDGDRDIYFYREPVAYRSNKDKDLQFLDGWEIKFFPNFNRIVKAWCYTEDIRRTVNNDTE
jgi:hypothetical protein